MQLDPPVIYVTSLCSIKITDIISPDSAHNLLIDLLCDIVATLCGLFDFPIKFSSFHWERIKRAENGIRRVFRINRDMVTNSVRVHTDSSCNLSAVERPTGERGSSCCEKQNDRRPCTLILICEYSTLRIHNSPTFFVFDFGGLFLTPRKQIIVRD